MSNYKSYTVRTMEREYNKSPWHENVLHMNEERFTAFLAAVTISTSDDSKYNLTFNSGLRKTACRVLTISDGANVVYNYGEGDTYMCSKTLAARFDQSHLVKNAA